MRISLLYNPNDRGINGNNWKLNNYRFFVQELSRQSDLDVMPIWGCDFEVFLKYNSNPDALILWRLMKKELEPMKLKNLDNVKCPKITRAPDAWQIDDYYNNKCRELGIDLVVSFQSPNCQYDFLDRDIPYERFILGIDEKTYPCVTPWEDRKKDKILSSGVLDDRWWFYRFRKKVTEHTFVEYVPKKEFLGVDYWKLLNKYRAAIACMSYTSVLKYFEIPMCGCLMFAEVTHYNQIEEMGFEDGVNCVYINDLNYKQRFAEYMDTVDDPKWELIAERGKKLIMERYTNEREVARFIEAVQGMVDAKSL